MLNIVACMPLQNRNMILQKKSITSFFFCFEISHSKNTNSKCYSKSKKCPSIVCKYILYLLCLQDWPNDILNHAIRHFEKDLKYCFLVHYDKNLFSKLCLRPHVKIKMTNLLKPFAPLLTNSCNFWIWAQSTIRNFNY